MYKPIPNLEPLFSLPKHQTSPPEIWHWRVEAYSLLTGCHDGCLRLFDLRKTGTSGVGAASRPVQQLELHLRKWAVELFGRFFHGGEDGEVGKMRCVLRSMGDTLQGTNISPPKGSFEDDFPLPKLGYVSSLEGRLIHSLTYGSG